MKYNPEKHNRRSIRLKNYDYSQYGVYFVPICTHNRECILGEIMNGEMKLNKYGQIIEAEWLRSSEIELDFYQVMSNHFHAIVIIVDISADVRANGRSPLQNHKRMKSKLLSSLMAGFKSSTTYKINKMRKTSGAPFWQGNYYEHIIGDEKELNQIREYIFNNPLGWELDKENPKNWGGKSIINKTILQ